MSVCDFPHCGLPRSGRGYCKTHYAQLRYHEGDKEKLKPIRGGGVPPKPCTFPGCENTLQAVGLCDGHYKQKARGEELRPINHYRRVQEGDECTVPGCTNRPQMKGVCKPHVKLKSSYRLSDEQIVALFTNPCCQACGEIENLHVDHDHTCCPGFGSCGQCVRGLLCHWCNTALGLMKDDPARIQNLITYLETR